MDEIVFVIVGNFITACYSRDFTLFNLLRKPVTFNLLRDKNFLFTKIPKRFPWNEFVIEIGDNFVTKLKDIPLRKGVKEGDKEFDIFYIDVSTLENEKVLGFQSEITKGLLIYSPWYRFVSEPFNFDKNDFGNHVSGAILYLFQSQGIKGKLVKVENKYVVELNKNLMDITQIYVNYENHLDKIEVMGDTSTSEINFSENSLVLARKHSPICFDSLKSSNPEGYANLRLKKSQDDVRLIYEK